MLTIVFTVKQSILTKTNVMIHVIIGNPYLVQSAFPTCSKKKTLFLYKLFNDTPQSLIENKHLNRM